MDEDGDPFLEFVEYCNAEDDMIHDFLALQP